MPVDHPHTQSTKRRKRPMTAAARKALTFPAAPDAFGYTDEEWTATWLSWVRLAAMFVAVDDKKLTEAMARLIESRDNPDVLTVNEVLEGVTQTKQHLATLHKLLEAMLSRSFIALERLGYTPANPPPERGQHDAKGVTARGR